MNTVTTLAQLVMQPDVQTYLEISLVGGGTVVIEYNFPQTRWEVAFDEGQQYFDSETAAVQFVLEKLRS